MEKLPNKEFYGDQLSAIIYCSTVQVNGRQFLKYRYIDNTTRGINTFLRFASRFPGATHVNFYSKNTAVFIEQHKF